VLSSLDETRSIALRDVIRPRRRYRAEVPGSDIYVGRAELLPASDSIALDGAEDPTAIRTRGWDRDSGARPAEAPVLARLAIAFMLLVLPMTIVAIALAVAVR
jgi:hypothetical protein